MTETKQFRRKENTDNLETIPLEERQSTYGVNLPLYDTLSSNSVTSPSFGQPSEAVREVNFEFLEGEQEGTVVEERFSGN